MSDVRVADCGCIVGDDGSETFCIEGYALARLVADTATCLQNHIETANLSLRNQQEKEEE